MNTPIIKVLTVCVVMILLGAAIVPIIDAFNEQEESTTETYTYGDNIIHDVNVSTVIGDIASSGASYTFSEDAGGDWMLIPSYVLRDTQLTYKVLDGAYIYVPDSATTYAQYTVNGTEIPVTGMSLTFTQDTAITDATVYDLTVNVTDMSLPGVVIEHIIGTTGSVNIDDAVKAVTNGSRSFYIDTDGDLYTTGDNTYGQLGTGDNNNRLVWTKVASNVADVCLGDRYHSFYVSTNGDLYATGNNINGQLGTGDNNDVNAWTKVASNVSLVKTIQNSAFYVATNGDLYATGNNGFGQFGNGTTTSLNTWTKVASNVVSVHIQNLTSSFYIDTAGDLYAAGANTNGQLGNGANSNLNTWTKVASNVSSVTGVRDYSSGRVASFYVATNGDLYATGNNYEGQLGTGDNNDVNAWTKVASNVSTAITSGQNSFYVATNGDLYATGNGNNYRLGTGNTSNLNTWTKVASNASIPYTMEATSAYISTDDKLMGVGYNFDRELGINSGGIQNWTEAATDVQSYSSGRVADNSSFAGLLIKDNYTLWITGENSSGALGNGDTTKVRTWAQATIVKLVIIYTNPSDSVTMSDVRGNVANGVFTPSETGTYLKVNSTNLQHETYYIGDGRIYYVAQNGTVSETKAAPNATGLSHASLTFTALADPDKVYTVAGTTDAGYEVIIPYTASYDVTETVTKELIPLLSAVPLMMIVVFVVFLVSGLAVRRDY